MKHKRDTKKSKIAVIVILSVILALLIVAAVYLNLTEGQRLPPAGTTDPSSSEQTDHTGEPEDTTVAVEDLVISTDFCDLSFPGQWKDRIRTEFVESDEGGAVMFYGTAGGKETEIFTVLFSRNPTSAANPIGVIDADGEPVLVSIKMGVSDGAWTDEEHDEITAMREAVNHLIGQLRTQPGFSTDTDAMYPEQNQEDIQVVTPYVLLRYPGKWQDQVWAEYTQTADGGCATFYGAVGGEDVTLFVVTFGPAGEGAARIGYVQVNGDYVEVSVQVHKPENTDGWSDTDLNLLAAMQEGINDLLGDLRQNPGYASEPVTVPPETTEQGGEEDVVISTSYVELAIPAQWKNQMHTKIEDRTGGYAVTFIGTVGKHEEALFAVLFGVETDSSFPVGVLNVDGEVVTVSIALMEIVTDDTWSDAEMDAIAAMQESLNDVLGELSKNPDFTAQ